MASQAKAVKAAEDRLRDIQDALDAANKRAAQREAEGIAAAKRDHAQKEAAALDQAHADGEHFQQKVEEMVTAAVTALASHARHRMLTARTDILGPNAPRLAIDLTISRALARALHGVSSDPVLFTDYLPAKLRADAAPPARALETKDAA
jgi:hypothetical protein